MTTPVPVMVFTDLDGTLLNPHNYRYDAAIATIERLKSLGIPIIPVTSKTRAEVEQLRSALGLVDPFVVENGSGVFIAEDDDRFPLETDQTLGHYRVIQFGSSYREARDRVAKLSAALGVTLCGFGDLEPEDVYGITGLAIADAKLAQARDFTEPFMVPDRISCEEVKAAAASLGFQVVVGDRFSHAIDPRSGKGIAVQALIDLYPVAAENLTVIGLGNSPNDLEMLNVVSHPIVIPAENGNPHPGLADYGWPIAPQSGSAGWALAVDGILDQLALTV